MLRYLTSGESHGKCMLAILDGMPSGLRLSKAAIDKELRRRMLGYGRGKRMSIESDKVKILSGVRRSVTIASPVTLEIENVDKSIDSLPIVTHPRPGHADLAGSLKYDLHDIRSVLERASARETVARVAVGAVCKQLLSIFGIRVASHVVAIGAIEADTSGMSFARIVDSSERSAVRCADEIAAKMMKTEIDEAIMDSDTLGGVFEVIVNGAPAGLGSHVQWDRRLSARLAQAMMSIQAIKGVGIGTGFDAAALRGSMAHDEIFYKRGKGFFRKTNRAGGIEGGITNGEDIVIRVVMKPISTLRRPLASVDIKSKKPARATVERSDACAVPSAGVVGEAAAAFEIANAMIEKFGGDSVIEMKRNYDGYIRQLRNF